MPCAPALFVAVYRYDSWSEEYTTVVTECDGCDLAIGEPTRLVSLFEWSSFAWCSLADRLMTDADELVNAVVVVLLG